ncbi:hypothetical protein [Mycobacteroides salmoniphilum]|uniref:Uncharacterized protein n=1 Tax=Mycobacteroides salmoniphilum TaxID=404941 RepID=A0A4V3I1E8_9MYCO|nr:hypothetical protein [Mycobacteroides salmoniphilum]TEA09144.1 hypothetical protein CCUG60884_00313 [Mycobacteroides salmoniphilum]
MSDLEDHQRALQALREQMLARSERPAVERPEPRVVIHLDEFATTEPVTTTPTQGDGPALSVLGKLLRTARQLPLRVIAWQQRPAAAPVHPESETEIT